VKRAAFLAAAAAALMAPRGVTARSLSSKLREIARRVPGRIGIYARTMAPGPPLLTYRSSERFPTASTIKVLIMATAYAAEEASPGALDATVRFDRSELISGSDFMANLENGRRFTVRRLLAPMIQVSDNTAANLLISHFGVEAINGVGARCGMVGTHLARRFLNYTAIAHRHDNVSTPADLGQLLYLIERGARERVATIVSPEHCRAMVALMLGQTDRDGIPAALPRGTPVANKTGEIEGTRNDIAIVEPFGDSPFVLAVMTENLHDYRAGYAAIHAVTRTAYRAASRTFA
jgi:beta-lactamase class A